MQRFVYSPKVFIYVNTGGSVGDKRNPPNIVDLTNYTTAGTVNRVVNQVSTAEITIRNPGKKWTKPGNPTFRPMDPITIFMQRQKGYPVQVFTGYLDRTPWYHLYPGTCTLMASCTLKRLLHKYFDPALPYTFQFLAAHGWRPAGAGGGLVNRLEENEPADATGDDIVRDIVDDSGFGKLLYSTLTEIGDWRENEIYIEELPTNLAEKVGRVYRQFEDDNEEAAKDFNTLLRKLIGTTAQGGGGGNENVDSRAGIYTGPLDRDFPKGSNETISFNDAAMLAEMAGLPGITYAQIAIGESGLRPGAVSNDGGFGLWQMTPRVQSAQTKAKWESIGSYFNPWRNALMAKYLAGSGTGVSNYYGTGHVTDFNKHYTGPMPKSRLKEGTANNDEEDTDTSGPNGNGSLTPDSVEDAGGGTSSGADSTGKIYAPIAGNVNYGRGWHEVTKGVIGMTNTSGSVHWHSGVDAGVPTGTPCVAPVDGEIVMSQANWSDGGMIHFKFTKETDEIPAGTIIGWGHATNLRRLGPVKGGTTIGRSGNPGGGPHVHFIMIPPGQGSGGGDGKADPVPILRALQKGEGTPVDGGSGADEVGGEPGGGTTPDIEVVAKAAAFAAVLDWPSIAETAVARQLHGQKSLMNDKPLMPFIEQLTGASLRSFQSLPNGTFFAFYPDYFGEMGHRKPYWSIDDVEILDGAIELTDDNLVTHQYVVGDTIMGNGITPPEKIRSGGVVTVFNAFGTVAGTDGDPLVPQFDGKNGQNAALAFLQKYGPRPDYHEAPMIRSPYFEAFLAYQKFMLSWSRQFATGFTFTFMPELYPGGRVAFESHGLQCYIDSVTHSWDYTSGFTTNAVLSAPSAFGGEGKTLAYSSGLVRETNAGAIALPTEGTEARD